MYKHKFMLIALLFLLVLMVSCSGNSSENDSSEQTTSNNDKKSSEQESVNSDGPPSVSDLDPDDEMTPFIERGESLLDGSEQMTDEDEANKLSCLSCHADGSDTNGASFVGIKSEYPQFNEREDAVIPLEEKINYSIVRDLNGEKLEYDGEAMRSIIAYLTYISEGADYEEYKDEETIKDIPEPDLENGKKIYDQKIKNSDLAMWGEGSFTDGSNMSRMSVMTNYVKNHLPQDDDGSLSDQEATDIAGYILSQDRPEWKENDSKWPKGEKPVDFINKKERQEIKNGDFDWSVVNQD